MKYSSNVLFIEKIISNVLIKLGKKSLLKNKDFKIYQELHFEHWVKLSLDKNNTISIVLEITNGGLRIDIDRAEEMIDFSYEYINNNTEDVVNILMMIFTSQIMVQYCGKYLTKLYFINNGTVQTYTYSNTLLVFKCPKDCQEKLYLPIYKAE